MRLAGCLMDEQLANQLVQAALAKINVEASGLSDVTCTWCGNAQWQLHAIASHDRTVHTERTDRFRFPGMDWTQVRAAGVFEVAEDGRIRAWRDYFDMVELVASMPAQDI